MLPHPPDVAGGDVTVVSEPEKGSVFTLRLQAGTVRGPVRRDGGAEEARLAARLFSKSEGRFGLALRQACSF